MVSDKLPQTPAREISEKKFKRDYLYKQYTPGLRKESYGNSIMNLPELTTDNDDHHVREKK
jgi:hypothetical protein